MATMHNAPQTRPNPSQAAWDKPGNTSARVCPMGSVNAVLSARADVTPLHAYAVLITRHDASQSLLDGLYRTDFDAIDFALDRFPDAKRISARRLT